MYRSESTLPGDRLQVNVDKAGKQESQRLSCPSLGNETVLCTRIEEERINLLN